ncbi:hypothetical protein [Psychrobacter piscatorii]|uniref:Uncharacterized protein n=1 Tax=Psychrobacter piscatorii TaxID=554343 RepID=A0A0T6DTP4_9GAMM|nr:hypothetical protein [Psychrobacter piscatorii]KRU23263.1 hypothetical protein AS194_04860 [Psychrobacter piscatorii]
MPKLKNRDKRKAAKVKKRNQAKQQKREAGEFIKEFTGYMQLSFKEETDDETIRKNVIRCGDWLKNSYQIFKNPRRYLVGVKLFKFDKSIEPAELEWATETEIAKENIVDLAAQMADKMSKGHDDVDFDNSYIRIYA